MKKLIALVSIIALILSLAACGNKKDLAENTGSDLTDTTISSVDDNTEKTESDKPQNDADEKPESDSTTTDSPSEPQTPQGGTDSKQETPKDDPSSKQETPKDDTSSKQDTPVKNEPTNASSYFLNENNNNYDIDAVSIKPRYVYWKNGELIAECFVINGFSHNVYNLDVKSLSFSNKSGVIASAVDFGILNGVNLPPYTNVVWTFRFSADCVAAYGADLSSLICDASVNYSY